MLIGPGSLDGSLFARSVRVTSRAVIQLSKSEAIKVVVNREAGQ